MGGFFQLVGGGHTGIRAERALDLDVQRAGCAAAHCACGAVQARNAAHRIALHRGAGAGAAADLTRKDALAQGAVVPARNAAQMIALIQKGAVGQLQRHGQRLQRLQPFGLRRCALCADHRDPVLSVCAGQAQFLFGRFAHHGARLTGRAGAARFPLCPGVAAHRAAQRQAAAFGLQAGKVHAGHPAARHGAGADRRGLGSIGLNGVQPHQAAGQNGTFRDQLHILHRCAQDRSGVVAHRTAHRLAVRAGGRQHHRVVCRAGDRAQLHPGGGALVDRNNARSQADARRSIAAVGAAAQHTAAAARNAARVLALGADAVRQVLHRIRRCAVCFCGNFALHGAGLGVAAHNAARAVLCGDSGPVDDFCVGGGSQRAGVLARHAARVVLGGGHGQGLGHGHAAFQRRAAAPQAGHAAHRAAAADGLGACAVRNAERRRFQRAEVCAGHAAHIKPAAHIGGLAV